MPDFKGPGQWRRQAVQAQRAVEDRPEPEPVEDDEDATAS
jgi:hypothetical protein